MVLILLYEGAQDETAQELAAVMQLPASRTAVRDRFSAILRSLQVNHSNPAVHLHAFFLFHFSMKDKQCARTVPILQAISPAYALNVGTRIYVDSGIMIRQRYRAVVKTFYNTDVISANLSEGRPVVNAINSWVSNLTDANIDRMIEDGKGRIMELAVELFPIRPTTTERFDFFLSRKQRREILDVDNECALLPRIMAP